MPGPWWRSVKVRFPEHGREHVIDRLAHAVPGLRARLPVRKVVLFGFYAARRATGGSDIDVLVVYDDPPRPDAFAAVRRTVGLRGLEAHVYAASEYREVRDVVDRMTAGGVVVYDAGAERAGGGPG